MHHADKLPSFSKFAYSILCIIHAVIEDVHLTGLPYVQWNLYYYYTLVPRSWTQGSNVYYLVTMHPLYSNKFISKIGKN